MTTFLLKVISKFETKKSPLNKAGQLKYQVVEGILVPRNMSERKDSKISFSKICQAIDKLMGRSFINALAQRTKVFY